MLIEVRRGGSVESRHRGSAAVAAADGRIVAAWGDIDTPVFPRSALKPLQALSWLETAACERDPPETRELAIACGSHGGEPEHVACVTRWLARLRLSEAALVCGPHPPLSEDAAAALVRAGRCASPLHNNCSGKHAGFLAAAQRAGEPARGYAEADHPVQARVACLLDELTGTPVSGAEASVDGCGAPIFALPLAGLARAFARLAEPTGLAVRRRRAARRVLAAMVAEPFFVGGSGRFDSDVIAAAAGAALIKGGAEGVYAAVLPTLRLGIALKIDDGAKRAAEAAISALLLRFLPCDGALRLRLQAAADAPLINTQRRTVGRIAVADGWPD